MSIVLFVHQSSEMYGSDKVLFYLVQGLQEAGIFQPLVVLPETGALHSKLLSIGVEVHIGEIAKISRSVMSPTGLFRLLYLIFKGARDIDRIVHNRDVALVHSNTLAVLSGAIWSMIRRKKHLWHVHEIILSPKVVSKVFPFLVRLLSNRVISNSTLTEHWLLNEQPALTSRSVVVFNGLPVVTRASADDVQTFKTTIGASEHGVVVTLAGRINQWKGQDLLIKAALELKRRGQLENKFFVVIGDTAPGLEELSVQLKEKVRSLDLEDSFCFMPFVDDIWPVWFGTDIAVVPSTEPEPFGMVAIEAMAAGVPVIAAGHGGLLDIVVHEKTGLIFQPRNVNELADAIERLASNDKLRRSLGEAGKKRQEELFSISSQIEKTANIYKEMLA